MVSFVTCEFAVGALWVQEKVGEGELEITKVRGEDNLADLCTENLNNQKLNELMEMANFVHRDDRAEQGLEQPSEGSKDKKDDTKGKAKGREGSGG